jgi:hypothetical protein
MSIVRRQLLVIVLLTAWCVAATGADLPPPISSRLDVITEWPDPFGRVSRLCVAPDDRTIYVLENDPAALHAVDGDGRVELVLGPGPGPMEISSRRVTLSRWAREPGAEVQDVLALHSILEQSSLVLTSTRSVRRVRHDRILTASVPRDDGVIGLLYVPPDEALQMRLGGTERIGWFDAELTGRGAKWHERRTLHPFRYTGDIVVDTARSYFARLVALDASTVALVETIGDGSVVLFDAQCRRIGDFVIPHDRIDAGAAGMSEVHARLVARDVADGPNGRLHVLRGLRTEPDGSLAQADEILVLDHHGAVERRIAVPAQLKCFDTTSEDGVYVGFTNESREVVRIRLDP